VKPLLVLLLLCSSISLLQAAENLLTVTGEVRKLAESSTGSNSDLPRLMEADRSVFGSEPVFDNSNLIPAVGVEVRFWQPDSPNLFLTAQTDESGNYSIGLGEGVWIGEACGSGNGFYPAAWNLSIENSKLKSMQAVAQKEIRIDIATPTDAARPGESLTLTGSGFGCNGQLRFIYSNYVDIHGDTHAVEYGIEDVIVSDFSSPLSRSNTNITFVMPRFDQPATVSKNLAYVRYEQGNSVSNSIPVAELGYAVIPQSVQDAIEEIEAEGAEVDMSNLEDGDVGTGNIPGSTTDSLATTPGPESASPTSGSSQPFSSISQMDLGVQAHMSSAQLNNAGATQITVDIPEGF